MRSYLLLIWIGICPYTQLLATDSLQLWYNKPAQVWEEALPLGNGRLGMMPDGGVTSETIVLNDITLWSGSPQDANNYGAHRSVAEIQRLLLDGRNDDAEALVNTHFVSAGAGSGQGSGAKVPYGSFQMLGTLRIDYVHPLDTVAAYRRQLDLSTAVASTAYQVGGVNFHREYFTAFDGDVGVVHLTADKPGSLNFTLTLTREERGEVEVSDGEIRLTGMLDNGLGGMGMQYMARIDIQHKGGALVTDDNKLSLRNANEATVYISAATDFRGNAPAQQSEAYLSDALRRSYQELKDTHISAFQKLFNRVSLVLAGQETTQLPTDERLKRFFDHPADDNAFAALYFQYGRYLSICSTRPGWLPPNLQGLWARTIQTPWNGDYHLNINAQMNHWPVEVTNLSELHEPFIALVKRIAEEGTKTAKAYYNAPGWVCHMMTNVWGYTAPGEQASWGASTASGWLCRHLWEHYRFTQDTAYLADIYPVLRDAARFYHHTLIREREHGWLVTAPSVSPENAFLLPTGKQASVVMGPTIDNQIVRELYTSVISAASILAIQEAFIDSLKSSLSDLPPPVRIGTDGRIMEWLEEYQESEPEHRHVSHLYGLYPAAFINPQTTPVWADAARKTLTRRGDGGTGWSRAWKVLFWARLQDGNHALEILRRLLTPVKSNEVDKHMGGGTYLNLFCAHPPFQIDGNFGGTAGIAEMLLQSHGEFIHLLPALPDAWANGAVSGLKARGNYTVDMEWRNGKVVDYRVYSPSNKPVDVLVNGALVTVNELSQVSQ